MTIDEVLKEIEENKKIAEGRIIGCFLNKIDLITDYSLNPANLTDTSRFYYGLISELFASGYKDMDKVTVMAFLKDSPELLQQFNDYGGYQVLSGLAKASSVANLDATIKEFEKYVMLEELHKRNFRIEDIYEDKLKHMPDANTMSAFFEYQLADASLEVSHSDIEFQTFEVTDEDLERFRSGAMIGIRYNETSPLLDYSTLGFPVGEFSIIGSYINHGKTSFVAYTMYGMAGRGQKVGIIANEQDLDAYKQLLIMYVLSRDLKYKGINRKAFKMGAWSDEDYKQIKQAQAIIKEKYMPNLSFLEVFDYDTTVVSRAIRRWSKMGFELAIYDTLKADFTSTDGWISLIKSTRNLYQLAHREQMAVVGVMQLAMSQMNRRKLNLDVLANGKQASETASEVIFFRNLFPDELSGEKNEAQVYRFKKDSKGKFTEIKELVEIDDTVDCSEYKVFTICKTRNDKVGTSILYRFHGDHNVWEEIGYIDIVDDTMAK